VPPLQLGAVSAHLVRLWVNPALWVESNNYFCQWNAMIVLLNAAGFKMPLKY